MSRKRSAKRMSKINVKKKGSYSLSHKFSKNHHNWGILGFFSTERKLVQSFHHAYDQNHNVAAKYPVLIAHCFNSSLLIHLTQILKLCLGSPTQNLHGQLTQKCPPASINSFLYLPFKASSVMENKPLVAGSDFDGNATGKAIHTQAGWARDCSCSTFQSSCGYSCIQYHSKQEVIRTDSTPLAIWYLIMQQACQQACWIGFKISYKAQWSHNPHYTRPGTSLSESTSALLGVRLTVFSLSRTYWSHLILQYICFKEVLPLQLLLGGSVTIKGSLLPAQHLSIPIFRESSLATCYAEGLETGKLHNKLQLIN